MTYYICSSLGTLLPVVTAYAKLTAQETLLWTATVSYDWVLGFLLRRPLSFVAFYFLAAFFGCTV